MFFRPNKAGRIGGWGVKDFFDNGCFGSSDGVDNGEAAFLDGLEGKSHAPSLFFRDVVSDN